MDQPRSNGNAGYQYDVTRLPATLEDVGQEVGPILPDQEGASGTIVMALETVADKMAMRSQSGGQIHCTKS